MGVESIGPVRGLQQWTPPPSTVSIPRCGSLPVAGMAAAGSEAALEAGLEAEAVEMGAWEGVRAEAREAEPVEPVGWQRTCTSAVQSTIIFEEGCRLVAQVAGLCPLMHGRLVQGSSLT